MLLGWIEQGNRRNRAFYILKQRGLRVFSAVGQRWLLVLLEWRYFQCPTTGRWGCFFLVWVQRLAAPFRRRIVPGAETFQPGRFRIFTSRKTFKSRLLPLAGSGFWFGSLGWPKSEDAMPPTFT